MTGASFYVKDVLVSKCICCLLVACDSLKICPARMIPAISVYRVIPTETVLLSMIAAESLLTEGSTSALAILVAMSCKAGYVICTQLHQHPDTNVKFQLEP